MEHDSFSDILPKAFTGFKYVSLSLTDYNFKV